jgi:hypothetical protein
MLACQRGRIVTPENSGKLLPWMRKMPVKEEITKKKTGLLPGEARESFARIIQLTGPE